MAHQQHEQTLTLVEFDLHGHTMQAFSRIDPHTLAESYAKAGNTNVAIVTYRETWRGRNGKRTRVEVSREEIAP